MRTFAGLFERLVDLHHLERAAARTLRGKRRRPDVAWLDFRRDAVLAELAERLRAGSWRPRRPTVLYVREPKPRAIARSPVEDRIVHNAVALLLEPVFLRSASGADFACRSGFGTHRAVLRVLELSRRFSYALRLDLRSYFPSIDLGILGHQLARRVRDARFLGVVDRILEAGRGVYDAPGTRRFARIDPDWPPAGRGLPIGAATSQLFAAHVHLQPLDHHVQRQLRILGYVRYVDDMLLFGNRRGELARCRGEVAAFLERRLGLRLKHPRAPVLSCRASIDALGFRIRRTGVEPLPATWRRLRGRMGDYVRGRGRLRSEAALARSLCSAAGHLLFG